MKKFYIISAIVIFIISLSIVFNRPSYPAGAKGALMQDAETRTEEYAKKVFNEFGMVYLGEKYNNVIEDGYGRYAVDVKGYFWDSDKKKRYLTMRVIYQGYDEQTQKVKYTNWPRCVYISVDGLSTDYDPVTNVTLEAYNWYNEWGKKR